MVQRPLNKTSGLETYISILSLLLQVTKHKLTLIKTVHTVGTDTLIINMF